jgi:hypothetical protein
MEKMTHRWWAEIAAEKRSPFRPHRGLATPDIFLDTILDRRTWETCLIDCIEALGNIYENGSKICHPKGKTYRDAHLGELVHSIKVEHAPEHEVICESEPAGEKHEEGETATEWQPPRASGCEAVTSLQGWWLGVAETLLQQKHKAPLPGMLNVKMVYDTSTKTTTRATCGDSLLEGLRL